MNQKPGLLYYFLKIYLRPVFRLYYRRIRIKGKEHIPVSGPVIFAVNHQNAFMDALVVATASVRNPWFLTRASVFASSVVRFWLNKLQLIPIYRFRDGMAAMKRNEETLETCRQLLQNNQCILIFPEGSHEGQWSLRPLQKGLARIVFSAMEKLDGELDIQIVPVGLQYENIFAGWSDLLISFGKPIHSSTYYQLYKTDSGRAELDLMEEVRQGISALMVDIQPAGEYQTRHEALLARPGREADLVKRLEGDKQFLREFNSAKSASKPKQSSLNKLWCLPSAILLLPHLPALWLIRMVVNAIVKDHHWTSSIRLAAFAFGAPFVYAAELYMLSGYFKLWQLVIIALLILPATGLVGLRLRDRCHGSAL